MATKNTVKKRSAKSNRSTPRKPKERYAIIANGSYGLYVGIVVSHDVKTATCIVKECRHVRYWYGKTGGITSLAAYGLCGPRASESRIGAPCDATLTNVVNVFDCTEEARATFEATTVK